MVICMDHGSSRKYQAPRLLFVQRCLSSAEQLQWICWILSTYALSWKKNSRQESLHKSPFAREGSAYLPVCIVLLLNEFWKRLVRATYSSSLTNDHSLRCWHLLSTSPSACRICKLCLSPYKKGYIEAIEKIQKRATKLVISLRKLPYKERLQHLNLYYLKYRRLRRKAKGGKSRMGG